MNESVLIVEDDLDLGQLLMQYLELNGFQVSLAENGLEARRLLKESVFDIVLTDVMMPVEDGFSFAENLSQTYPHLPFLFITARKMKEDVLKGLSIGADDYIVKPFNADELVLRVRNILKRTSKKAPAKDILTIGIFTFLPKELLLIGPSGRRVLTERESDLLLLLCENLGQLVRKRDILNRLWKETDFFSGRSLDVFVSRLRKYLSDDPGIILESSRGTGLRLTING